jgi:hypothetical protein
MLANSKLESSSHFENPPTFFTTGGSKSFDLFAPFLIIFMVLMNLKVGFIYLKLKQNKNIWLLAALKCLG